MIYKGYEENMFWGEKKTTWKYFVPRGTSVSTGIQ